MLLFCVHEPQAYKGRRAEEPNRNCARYAFRFSSSAATVPSTIISESRFLSPAQPTFYRRLQQSRCLPCCSDCYRVERTSSRASIPPPWTSAFHGAQANAVYQPLAVLYMFCHAVSKTYRLE